MSGDSEIAFLHCSDVDDVLDPMMTQDLSCTYPAHHELASVIIIIVIMQILQVGKEVAEHLKESGVGVKDYNALLGDIKTLAQTHTKLWADPTKASSYM